LVGVRVRLGLVKAAGGACARLTAPLSTTLEATGLVRRENNPDLALWGENFGACLICPPPVVALRAVERVVDALPPRRPVIKDCACTCGRVSRVGVRLTS
jgi:hypothetical protein